MWPFLQQIFSCLLSSCTSSISRGSIASDTPFEGSAKVLPDDITEVILSRLPVKSLFRFKCVCKAWSTLISNPYFVNLHLERSTENNNFVLLKGFGHAYLLDCGICNSRLVSFGTKPFSLLSSCNGLLCIRLSTNNIWLWNPSTNEKKKIPKPSINRTDIINSYVTLGIVCHPTSKDYEIVRATSFEGDVRHSEVEVYSLRTNLWTRIQNIPYSITCGVVGIFFDGALHWVGRHCTEENTPVILAFDIGNRNFREVQLPELDNSSFCLIDVSVLDGYLCLLCTYNSYVEVWVMKEYGVRETWNKCSICQTLRQSVAVTKKGEIILQQPCSNSLSVYDPKDQTLRDLVLQPIPDVCSQMGMAFVESLVPL